MEIKSEMKYSNNSQRWHCVSNCFRLGLKLLIVRPHVHEIQISPECSFDASPNWTNPDATMMQWNARRRKSGRESLMIWWTNDVFLERCTDMMPSTWIGAVWLRCWRNTRSYLCRDTATVTVHRSCLCSIRSIEWLKKFQNLFAFCDALELELAEEIKRLLKCCGSRTIAKWIMCS